MAIPLFDNIEQALVDSYIIRPRGDAMKRIDAEQNRAALQSLIDGTGDAITDLSRMSAEEQGFILGNAIDQQLAKVPRVPNPPAGGGEYSGIGTAVMPNPTDFSALQNLVGRVPRVPNPPAGGGEYSGIDTAVVSNPTDFSAFQRPDIPTGGDEYGGIDTAVVSNPNSRTVAEINAGKPSQAERYQNWLATPAGQSFARNNPGASQELLNAAPATAVQVAPMADPMDAMNAPMTEEEQFFTSAATGDGTTIGKRETSAGGNKASWFDAINDKVDLMAMGAAMLAGAGSGKGTIQSLGMALEAGRQAKIDEATAAENKQYKDALIAIQMMNAQKSAGSDRFKNYTSKISNLESKLRGSGLEGEVQSAAEQLYAINPSVINMPDAMLTDLSNYLADEVGDNWFSQGGDVDLTAIREATNDWARSKTQGSK
jgi:hypothetical protein